MVPGRHQAVVPRAGRDSHIQSRREWKICSASCLPHPSLVGGWSDLQPGNRALAFKASEVSKNTFSLSFSGFKPTLSRWETAFVLNILCLKTFPGALFHSSLHREGWLCADPVDLHICWESLDLVLSDPKPHFNLPKALHWACSNKGSEEHSPHKRVQFYYSLQVLVAIETRFLQNTECFKIL